MTIILTTHYIEEAEEMADRVGVINKGELILVEDKTELMRKLGRKQLTLQLREPLDRGAGGARRLRARRSPTTAASSSTPTTPQASATGIAALLDDLRRAGIALQGPAHRRRARSRTSSSAW